MPLIELNKITNIKVLSHLDFYIFLFQFFVTTTKMKKVALRV